jgi:hypothetical protein
MMLSLASFKAYGVRGKFDEGTSHIKSGSNTESLPRLSLDAQGESLVMYPDVHTIKILASKAG